MSPRPTPITIASFQPRGESRAGARATAARTIAVEVMRKISEAQYGSACSGGVHRREVEAEPDRGEERETDAGGDPSASAGLMLLRGERRRREARRRSPRTGSAPDGRRSGSRTAPARSPRRPRSARRRPSPRSPSRGSRRRGRASPRSRRGSRAAPRGRAGRCPARRQTIAIAPFPRSAPRASPAGRRACAPATGRRSRRPPRRGSRRARAEARSPGGPGGGARVELVRVVEHAPPRPSARRGRRGATATQWSSSARWARREALGVLLDQPQAEMDMPEQPALLGRREGRARA